MHRMAQRNDTVPGDLPLSVADTNASLHGMIAMLAALHMRDQTGQGQHIDMSMMDATFATDDRSHFEMENAPDTLPVCPIVDLPFGPVFLASDMKLLFKRLNRRSGLVDPTPPDADLGAKVALRNTACEERLKQCTTVTEFSELMDVLDIPWGQVRDPHDLEQQTTLKHREMIVQMDDRAGGKRPMAQSPYRFSNAASGIQGPAAHRGEHNEVVLKDWLQWSDAKISALVATNLFVDSSAVEDQLTQ